MDESTSLNSDNPSFSVTSDEVDSVVAELCASTSSSDIKECIRSYKFGKDYNQLKRDFNKFNKQKLECTLEHLNVPEISHLKKPDLVHKIILRIQNLFPDLCTICNKKYCIKNDDAPLLGCRICGQEVHRDCFMKYVSDDLKEDLTEEKMLKIINPLNIPGFYYVCKPCAESSDIAMYKDSENVDKTAKNPSGRKKKVTKEKQNSISDQNTADKNNPEDGGEEKPKAVCQFYLKRKCKHGLRGKGCDFLHPPLCKRYMNHGTSHKGCTLNKKCGFVHPKMCYSSLKKRECSRAGCSYYHVRDTQFNVNNGDTRHYDYPTQQRYIDCWDRGHNDDKQLRPTYNRRDKNTDFLSQASQSLESMRADLLEAIDMRLSTVLSTLQM